MANLGKMIGTLTLALGITMAAGCATSRHVSLNQMPMAAQATVDQHVRGGHIHEIHSESRDGMLYYDVDYSRAGQHYDLRVDESGKLLQKEES